MVKASVTLSRFVAHSMKTTHHGYFQSLARELESQASRVRQLIGDGHWAHDGRHKEVLLQSLIRRHCPSTVLVSTGFVVSSNDPEVRSKEQDVLIINTSTEAPLFHQGDLTVVFPHTVIAAISVKTTMNDETLKDVVDGLATVRETARDCQCKANRICCCGFFFNIKPMIRQKPEAIYKSLKKHIRSRPIKPPLLEDGLPHIAGPDAIVEANDLSFLLDYTVNNNISAAKVRGFDCPGLSTAVFLSCLLEHINFFFDQRHSKFNDLLSN